MSAGNRWPLHAWFDAWLINQRTWRMRRGAKALLNRKRRRRENRDGVR